MFKDMTVKDSEELEYKDDEQFKKLLENMHKNMEFETDPSEDDEVED